VGAPVSQGEILLLKTSMIVVMPYEIGMIGRRRTEVDGEAAGNGLIFIRLSAVRGPAFRSCFTLRTIRLGHAACSPDRNRDIEIFFDHLPS
jgi:hypothetical protein